MRFTALIMGLLATPALASAGDTAAEVRAVFSAKCAACHGPGLTRPKGRFGYVLDLARVAGNREMVVAGAPD
jgi:mono/diheme cytochrome c family protein